MIENSILRHKAINLMQFQTPLGFRVVVNYFCTFLVALFKVLCSLRRFKRNERTSLFINLFFKWLYANAVEMGVNHNIIISLRLSGLKREVKP